MLCGSKSTRQAIKVSTANYKLHCGCMHVCSYLLYNSESIISLHVLHLLLAISHDQWGAGERALMGMFMLNIDVLTSHALLIPLNQIKSHTVFSTVTNITLVFTVLKMSTIHCESREEICPFILHV